MQATIKVTLKPFQVPNFVLLEVPLKRRAEGFGSEDSKVALADLDPYDLDRMCNEFRNTVFTKAGKEQPPSAAPICAKCGKFV